MNKFVVSLLVIGMLVVSRCSMDPIAGGSGTETINSFCFTVSNQQGNGVRSSVRVRSSNYLPGANNSNFEKIDTTTDSTGKFLLKDIRKGAYTFEILDDNGNGALIQMNLSEDTSLGNVTLTPNSELFGYVDTSYIPDSIGVTVSLYGMERVVPISESGIFILKNLPGGTYSMRIESNSEFVGATVIPFVKVSSQSSTYMDTTRLPIQYQKDSLLVMEYLKDQGIDSIDWSRAVTLDQGQRIRKLDLSNNRIEYLKKSIGKLTFITTLDLSGNPLKEFPPEMQQLNLSTLMLNKVRMDSMINGFDNIQKLTMLYLDSTGIQKLPSNLPLLNLRTLYLSNNNLSSIPAVVFECKSLRRLTLNKNSLDSVPDKFGLLTELDNVDFANNRITGITSTIGNLRRLSTISFTENKLKEVPKELFDCYTLTRLLLINNDIVTLPPEIAKLQYMEELQLNGNALTELPVTIGKCASLSKLTLYKNELTTLPLSITELTNLNYLMVNECRLCAVDSTISSWISHVTESQAWKGRQRCGN